MRWSRCRDAFHRVCRDSEINPATSLFWASFSISAQLFKPFWSGRVGSGLQESRCSHGVETAPAAFVRRQRRACFPGCQHVHAVGFVSFGFLVQLRVPAVCLWQEASSRGCNPFMQGRFGTTYIARWASLHLPFDCLSHRTEPQISRTLTDAVCHSMIF